MTPLDTLVFANAWAWWLMPPLLLLSGLLVIEGRRRAVFLRAFGERSLVRGFSRLGSERRGWLRPLSLSLALVGVVTTLAGPVWTASPERDGPPMDIVVLLDVSRSMAAEDYAPTSSRLEQAKAMLLRALPSLADRRIGVVTFAGAPFRQAPLTADHAALEYIFAHWVFIESAPGGGSDIAQGLRAAIALFEGRQGDRLLLLFSDGGETRSEELHAALAEARSKSVRVLAFGLGGPTASRIPEYRDGRFAGWLAVDGELATTRLDEDALREIATATEGAYARVVSGGELARTLSRLGLVTVPTSAGVTDLFQWPLAAALVFLFLERAVAGAAFARGGTQDPHGKRR